MIRSKTGVTVNELGDQFILLGPYKEFHARQEVGSSRGSRDSLIEEEDIPEI